MLKYGAEIIKKLSKELREECGKGFTKCNLCSFYSLYKTYTEKPLPHIMPIYSVRHSAPIWQTQVWTLRPCSM
ncbi:MAG: DUF1016 domain-containing protein [Lachnospiraceae bacterium]|nr:DUF1016 domain-containing protein [Lachnospiraceae bacterium]